MWYTSQCLLKRGQEKPEGSFHQFAASLVFTAFSFEAALNHIGAKIFDCWNYLERLTPREKIDVLATRLQFEVNFDRRPWQVVKPLFRFRNATAHGKTEKFESTETLPDYRATDEELESFALTAWEEYCTAGNAVRAREDVESIVRIIYESAAFQDDLPFLLGFHEGSQSPAGE